MLPRIIDFLIILTYITQTGALYCLSCTDSISPRHCHTVRKCSDGEVCFTESHRSENGIVLFDTGCAIAQACRSKRENDHDVKSLHGVDPHYHHSRCMECCSSHLCNNQGCGQPGYPSSRGPVCFDCQQVSDPRLCDKLKVCEMNQACYLQRELEFGDVYYTSSCINKHACTSSVNIFGKRNIERCSKCCLADLCNNQCGSVTDYSMSTSFMTTSMSLTQSSTAKPTSTATDSMGNEFLILFMRNHVLATEPPSIYITTHNETTVTISSSTRLNANLKSATDRKTNINSHLHLTLPYDLTCEYSKVESKAVILETSELSLITIFDSNYGTTNDGTLVIPTNKLSTKYLVSSTEPFRTSNDYYSQFAIGSVYDGSSIKITFKMKAGSSIALLNGIYRNGDVFALNLDKLETFQVGHTTDLSGTLITSTKPIAVFSGNRCQHLKDGCSHMVTQLPPTTELDNRYVVPPFYNDLRTLIQVISENQSMINLSVQNNFLTWHLKEKGYKNLEVTANETTVIVSDNPVLVSGVGMGRPYGPYMTIIPGVHQYVSYYKITIPGTYRENFISVIIPSNSVYNLRINNYAVNPYTIVYQGSAMLEENFAVVTFAVHNGTLVLATNDNAKFGLIVFGHRGNDGYGFAGNFVHT